MSYTSEIVAQWKYEKIKKDASLQQDVTAQYILDNFGEEFTYINENRSLAISRAVLKNLKNYIRDMLYGISVLFAGSGSEKLYDYILIEKANDFYSAMFLYYSNKFEYAVNS